MFELSQGFFFDAAHTLQRELEREGSLRIHGHTYHAEVTIVGMPSEETGMVVDLGILRTEIDRVREQLDHRFLDDVPALGPATLENLCRFIHRMLVPTLPNVVSVVVARKASGDRCTMRVPATSLPQEGKTRQPANVAPSLVLETQS